MANAKSNIIQALESGTAAKLTPTDIGGKVRIARAVYAGSDAAGTVIELARLPKGARVLSHLSALEVEAGQNSALTIKVGISGDDDAFMAATATGAANAVKPFTGSLQLDKEEIIIATTGAQALTAGKSLVFLIAYVTD